MYKPRLRTLYSRHTQQTAKEPPVKGMIAESLLLGGYKKVRILSHQELLI